MMGLTVIFLGVPAHIGIEGNEMADKTAKEAKGNKYIDLQVSASKSEIESMIKQRLRERRQK